MTSENFRRLIKVTTPALTTTTTPPTPPKLSDECLNVCPEAALYLPPDDSSCPAQCQPITESTKSCHAIREMATLEPPSEYSMCSIVGTHIISTCSIWHTNVLIKQPSLHIDVDHLEERDLRTVKIFELYKLQLGIHGALIEAEMGVFNVFFVWKIQF